MPKARNSDTTKKRHSAYIMRPIAASTIALSPRPVEVYVGAGGTIDIVNDDTANSVVAGIPVFAGGRLPVQFYKITAIDGGATLYGLYYR